AIFIDEVQDFTESQIFLMGLSVSERYSQITLSGDRYQRLQAEGAVSYEHLFPLVSRTQQNRPIFLDINFRQRDELAALSSGIREKLQNDRRIATTIGPPAALHVYTDRAAMARLILKRIKSIPSHATAAVICGSKTDARAWFELLEEDLAAEHRPARLS